MALFIVAVACFMLALGHTFAAGAFSRRSNRYLPGSIGRRLLGLLGTVELTFAIWALVFLALFCLLEGPRPALDFLRSRSFIEPLFVFVIIAVCSSEPILAAARAALTQAARAIPLPGALPFYVSALILGPLLGSFITEPAAMTVTALLLLERVYSGALSMRLKYATLGLLLVNISIGGTLTPFAAPPVLMVAREWGWDLPYMLANFGWKGALAAVISTALVAFLHRRELSALSALPARAAAPATAHAVWIAIHLALLAGVVVAAHEPVVLIVLFAAFIGLERARNARPHLHEAVLVAVFLAGLVILGAPQSWWMEPLISQLQALPLYLGAIGLTAIVDNAALTYLGSQVPDLAEASRYALVAGAVVGGGLTIIANAPNPAGCAILKNAFGENGIRPFALFRAALLPTVIAGLLFWFF